MASRAYPQPAPLDLALSIIPSLPRPLLCRLVARMIDRLDEIDGDNDLEPEEDCCFAGDDDPGEGTAFSFRTDGLPGDPVDSEEDDPAGGSVDDESEDTREGDAPTYGTDQSRGPVIAWAA